MQDLKRVNNNMKLLTYRVYTDLSSIGVEDTNELVGYVTRLSLEKAILRLENHRQLNKKFMPEYHVDYNLVSVCDIEKLSKEAISAANLNDIDNLSITEEEYKKNMEQNLYVNC